jgi:hypothetical protein
MMNTAQIFITGRTRIPKGRPCLVLTLSFVRAVSLVALSQLAHFGVLSWQESGQIVLEEAWIQFVPSM